MRTVVILSALLIISPQASSAQSVPEGVHAAPNGPSEMCGLVGENASDLIAKARRSADLHAVPIPSDRFEMFEGSDPIKYQLVVTLPSEAAFPAASCRELYEEGGALKIRRSMRCDAGRAECDALFLEFQALDAEMTRLLRSGGS